MEAEFSAHGNRRAGRKPRRVFPVGRLLLFALWGGFVPAIAEGQSKAESLADLGLEELMEIEVTSVAKRPETVWRSPAAIHVVTGEQIRESGATSIPEALRLAPGVHVGQAASSQWVVSTRGFSELYANKQLVMIDGRSVYTPLFSGVFWDVTDTFMEDIDRIEVIRGPGASLWGANAVNGVINVITKNARDTQGGLIYAGAGTYEEAFTGVRHGGKLGEHGHFRIYGKHFQRDNLRLPDGGDADDRWSMNRGGFRADFEPDGPSRFTLQGDIYEGDEVHRRVEIEPDPNAPGPPPGPYQSVLNLTSADVYGGNVLGRATYSGLNDSEVELQSYYNHSVREVGSFRELRRTLDFDGKHNFRAGDRHQLMWGLGYRVTSDRIRDSSVYVYEPDRRTDHLFGTFVQDEVALIHDRLYWTVGSKFEHNDYTGFEVQPSTRLLWVQSERQSVWASVSRAVRTPSRANHDSRVNLTVGGGTLLSIFGHDDFRSEELIAYELGYRARPLDSLTFDAAVFYNDYDNLTGIEFVGFQFDPNDPHVRFDYDNVISGETYGGEISATWRASEWWEWRAGYSLLRMHLKADPGTNDTFTVEQNEGSSPRHQIFLRSGLDLPRGWHFSTGARYVDNLPALGVESYTEMDVRLAWRPGDEDVEFSLVGKNLLSRQHAEAQGDTVGGTSSEPVRSFYGRVAWRF